MQRDILSPMATRAFVIIMRTHTVGITSVDVKTVDTKCIAWHCVDPQVWIKCKCNKDHQQCSLSLVVKLGTSNFYSQGTKPPAYKQGKLAQNLHDENVWYANITKPFVIQSFMHPTIVLVANYGKLLLFYYLSSSYVLNFEAKSVVPDLNTRDKEYCW